MTRPCCKRSRCGTTFQCTNGEWRTAIASSMCWAIFSRYCGQRTMTNKGANRNVPHLLQAQQAPICLWSTSETLQCQKFRGIVRGGRVVRWCWVNFQCRGDLQFGYSRARAYCACSRCGWGLFGHFYSHLSFLSSFSLSLGDGPI